MTELSAVGRKESYLKLPEVLVDVLYIFTAEHRVVIIFSIYIPDSSAKNDI